MGIFEKILGIFGEGSIVKTIADTVMAYLPPEMSPEKKAEIALASAKQDNENQRSVMVLAHEMDKEFNQRVKDLEGTAADLKSVPVVGPILILLRGAQRPGWGFFTMYMDYMVYSKGWSITPDSQQSAAFFLINVLVLVFLFGERAFQNIMPYVIQFFGVKPGQKPV